ncbi:MAG: hypothetical protein ACE5IP_06540, partial [Terriglobia bacterium]
CGGGPLLSTTPPALYALAQEQIANANYSRAVDSLARAVRAGPQSQAAQRARVLRIALLGGMARGFSDLAASYLAGHGQAGDSEHASVLRSTAMDYFGRARGRSLEMVEALDALQRDPAAEPLRMAFQPLENLSADNPVLEQIRHGNPVSDKERRGAERERIQQGLAGMLVRLGGTERNPQRLWFHLAQGEVELDPAAFYLGAARELVEITKIYSPEALGDKRLTRLYHERAAALARRAAQLAEEKGDSKLRDEAGQFLHHLQQTLG